MPGSNALDLLNYDDMAHGVSTGDCSPYPPETTLDPETQYITYRGRSWVYPGLAQDCGSLSSWDRNKRQLSGRTVWSRSGCEENDTVVPANSVPLVQAGNGNIYNLTGGILMRTAARCTKPPSAKRSLRIFVLWRPCIAFSRAVVAIWAS